MAEWLRFATRRSIVRRASGYAIGVGARLLVSNHGDAILRGDESSGRLLRMLLTVMVPYGVSTASSVGAARERLAEKSRLRSGTHRTLRCAPHMFTSSTSYHSSGRTGSSSQPAY